MCGQEDDLQGVAQEDGPNAGQVHDGGQGQVHVGEDEHGAEGDEGAGGEAG